MSLIPINSGIVGSTRYTPYSAYPVQTVSSSSPLTYPSADTFHSTRKHAKSKEKEDFWDWLKGLVFHGLAEKIMLGAITYAIVQHRAPNMSRAPLVGLSLIGGLALGELFMKFEHWLEKSICRIIDPDNCELENKRWTFSTILSKTISAIILTAIAVGKKMFVFAQACGKHEDDIAKASKKGMAKLVGGLEESYNVVGKYSSKIKDGNILDTFHHSGEFFSKEMGASKNPLKAAAGKILGFKCTNLVGCPAMREAYRVGRPVKAKDIMADASIKMLLGVISIVGLTWLTDKLHQGLDSGDLS
jgi:hypothetical protein